MPDRKEVEVVKRCPLALRIEGLLRVNAWTSPEIARELACHTSSVRRELRRLQRMEHVECVNSAEARDRRYRLTPRGAAVVRAVQHELCPIEPGVRESLRRTALLLSTEEKNLAALDEIRGHLRDTSKRLLQLAEET